MIKINKYFFVFIFAMAAFVACSDDDNDVKDVEFAVETDAIAAPNVGMEQEVSVQASGTWVASIEDASWLNVSPANGAGSTVCSVNVDASVLAESRSAVIRFASETGETEYVKVTQMGFSKQIIFSSTDTVISARDDVNDEHIIEVPIVTNVPLDHIVIDPTDDSAEVTWVACTNYEDVDLDSYGEQPQAITLQFEWGTNVLDTERTATFVFNSSELEGNNVEYTITQGAGPGINDNRAGDSIAVIAVYEKLGKDVSELTSTDMSRWDDAVLWTKIDEEVKANPDMEGRLREIIITSFNTDDVIPVEIGYITYLESLYIGSNGNKFNRDIDLSDGEDGIHELVNLKNLTVYSYGLVGNIPSSWKSLVNLEYLDLSGNNFQSIPTNIKESTFPSLKYLYLTANRRYSSVTLNPILSQPTDVIGLYIEASNYWFKNLLKWDNLVELSLSNCVIYGEFPTAEDLRISDVYEAADMRGDSIDYALGKPKVLPNMKRLRMNLNFLHGDIPDWVLYHPNLSDWDPFTLFYTQDGQGEKLDEDGNYVGFDNVPFNWDYYYDVYPKLE